MNDDFTWNTRTKIASYVNGHSWYRNTLMATNKREINGCWDLDPIREGFYYFQKFIFVVFLKQNPPNLHIRKTLED
jgi:hypothetical protein